MVITASMQKVIFIAVAAVGMVLLGASLAWACTTQAHVSELSPASTSAGGEVTIKGAEYQSEVDVEIRWETDDGTILATTMTDAEGNFSVTATLPAEASAGEHLVLAIAPDLYPASGKGSAMVEIVGDEPPASGDTEPAPDDSSQEQPADEQQPAPAQQEQQPAPTAGTATEPQVSEQPAATPTAPAPATQPVSDRPAAATATDATGTTEAAVIDRLIEQSRADARAAAQATALQAPPAASVESAPDPWSIAQGRSGVVDQPPGSLLGSSVAAGIGLLAVGMVLLFAGVAVTTVTRRRAESEARD